MEHLTTTTEWHMSEKYVQNIVMAYAKTIVLQ